MEQNFAVMRRRPRKNSTEDYEKIIDDCFETVLEQRFINPRELRRGKLRKDHADHTRRTQTPSA